VRVGDKWLAQALIALWMAAVTLLHYGMLANTLLSRFSGR